MAEDASPPLLDKVYCENCPGCRVDRWKATSVGIPYAAFFYVWIVTLCTALPILSLFPYLYFMIRDLHVAKREEDIGYYAGYVGSSFMFGRALTSFFWGMVADRYGRKPVIIFGIISVIIFNTLFGLSTTLWMAISTRFLLGSLNGLLGPIKAFATEIAPQEYEAIGLSLVSTAWSIGLIAGPAIGGFLAQPAEKFPDIVSKGSLFGRFPYFLPCLFISLFAVGVFVACIWLPETLHKHKETEGQKTYESLEASKDASALTRKVEHEDRSGATSEENLFKNWPLMSSVIVYCVFCLHDMAYSETFSLWAESDRTFGGLSFTSQDVGEVLAVTGFSLLVFQLCIYPSLQRVLGPIVSARIAGVTAIPLLASYPSFVMLSGFGLSVVVNCASLLKNILSTISITGLFILQNHAVEQHQRGAANGISVTAMSLFKAIAPTGAGTLFAWAQKRQSASFLPGDQMVFFVLNAVQLLGVLLTFRPFLTTRRKQPRC